MLTAVALATVLAASPTKSTSSFDAKLDVGALVGSGWYVPQTRDQMMVALSNARGTFLIGNETLKWDPMLNATPIVGAWVLAANSNGYDQAMLITSGALQLIGSMVALKRLLLDEEAVTPVGWQLTISPIVAGQLGVGVRLTNF